ncbi:MAG: UDP-N-acetylmuramoyl-tripeptide--D-alanyl-D-alanine ligase [Parcubacteria group bacterium]|nr:UDP-N-acetylmuramoyl-tripeptide--D-alanyl-D-alanine ligase [Parcubacteria group bacterium]
MFEYIFYLAFFLWAVIAVKNVVWNVYLWQLKEYRFDRMLAHLQTKSGKEFFLNIFLALKILWILAALISEDQTFLYTFFISIYLFEWIDGVKRLAIEHTFYRPVLTKKALLLLGLAIGSIFIDLQFLFQWWGNYLMIMALFDVFVPDLVFFFVLAIYPFSQWAKKRLIARAKEKRGQFKNLIVIGITGSFGKTTTKEYLYALLSEKYKVLKTPEHVNTEVGAASVILKDLKSEHEIFIVEMGAYKEGEIKAICDLVQPKIGILTGIGDQHYALFGSMEKIVNAKFELIRSLPSDGVAILNADSQYVLDNLSSVSVRKIVYSQKLKSADIFAENIGIAKDAGGQLGLIFDLHVKEQASTIELYALGQQNISNFLAAAGAGLELGLTPQEIKKAALRVKPLDHTMKQRGSLSGALLIDDTYNANAEGIVSSLEYLARLPGTKILVLSSLLELGPHSEEANFQIGKAAGLVCDYIFYCSEDYKLSFADGALGANFNEDHLMLEEDCKKAASLLKSLLKPQTVVLFCGRGTQRILAQIESKI